MAWPLLSVSGCYCLGLSQLHVSIQRVRGQYYSEIIHPSVHQCLFSGNRIRTRFPLLNAQSNGDYGSEQLIEDLRVPQQWLQPYKALEVTRCSFPNYSFNTDYHNCFMFICCFCLCMATNSRGKSKKV